MSLEQLGSTLLVLTIELDFALRGFVPPSPALISKTKRERKLSTEVTWVSYMRLGSLGSNGVNAYSSKDNSSVCNLPSILSLHSHRACGMDPSESAALRGLCLPHYEPRPQSESQDFSRTGRSIRGGVGVRPWGAESGQRHPPLGVTDICVIIKRCVLRGRRWL